MSKSFWLIVLLLAWVSSIISADASNKEVPLAPAWDKLCYLGLDIIPSPKKIDIQQIRFLLNTEEGPAAVIIIPDDFSAQVRVATELINRSLKKKGVLPLEVHRERDLKGLLSEGKNAIFLGARGQSKFLDRALNEANLNLDNYPLGSQGYIIHFLSKNKGYQALLTGLDDQGVLYAAVTFSKLIQEKGESVIAKALNIVDWPDFEYRGGHGLFIRNLEEGKRLVDWFLRHKINQIHLDTRGGRNLAIRANRENWPWIREVNRYARERGIKIQYQFCWRIGTFREHGDDPRFRGAIQFKGNFFCWSRDELLNERIEKLKSFARETEADLMIFHCLDNFDAGWPERCDRCRDRWGDDRAAADAHFINSVTTALRSVNPDIYLQFVTQPYTMNLSLPGNERYLEYYRRLSSLIPLDVFLTTTSFCHDSFLAWNEVIKQPIVRHQNLATFQIGRFFDSSPAFFKGIYCPDRADMAFLNEPILWFDGDIIQLVGIEYTWNVAAPGALVLEDNPEAPITTIGPYHFRATRVRNKGISLADFLRHKSTTEPEETANILLERITRVLYGTNIGPYMARFLREGLTGWRDESIARTQARNAKEAREEYRRASGAYQALKQALRRAKTAEEIATVNRFLSRSIHPKMFYATYALALQAKEEVRKGNISAARNLIDKTRETIEISREKIKAEGFYVPEEHWDLETESWFRPAEAKIDLVKVRIEVERRRAERPLEKPKEGIRVAIYNPADTGGLTFHDTMFNCLSQREGIAVTYIDNLRFETLVEHQVLIMPHVRRFNPADVEIYRDSIRRFVIEKGGGAYFEHDAVGFWRSVLNESIFPEISLRGRRRKETFEVKVAKEHPALSGLEVGSIVEHMYWDHIVLEPGPDGTVILSNLDGYPVVMVGTVGKGRVIKNGMITLGRKDQAKEEADLVNKILLINGMRWLADEVKPKQNLIANPSFEDIRPDGRLYAWEGLTLTQTSYAHTGDSAGKITLATDQVWVNLVSRPFKVEPGAEFYIDFWIKRDGGCRVIPMLTFWGEDHRRQVPMVGFPHHLEMGEYTNHFGVIKAPEDKGFTHGRLEIFLDWFGGSKATTKNLFIDDVIVHKVQR